MVASLCQINKINNMTQKHHNESVDTNIESLSKAEAFITKNNKKIVTAVVAAVVVVVGILIFNSINEKKNLEAQDAFAITENDALMANDAEATAASLEALEMYLDEYGRHAVEAASFEAGIAAYAAKEYEKAIEFFADYKGDDEIYNARALACIGDCYAQLGDYEKAYASYVEAIEEADNEFASEYAFRAGLAAEKLGKKAEAVAMYKKIMDKYPTTPRAMGIEKYISRVEAK